jgi:hypothetical protein
MESLQINIENIENIENLENIDNQAQIQKDIEVKKDETKKKYKELITLKLKMDVLSKTEYIEIYKIIKFNNEKFSQNKNGIMFDIMKFSDDTIQKINGFINYIESNNLVVESDEQQRNTFRNLFN